MKTNFVSQQSCSNYRASIFVLEDYAAQKFFKVRPIRAGHNERPSYATYIFQNGRRFERKLNTDFMILCSPHRARQYV